MRITKRSIMPIAGRTVLKPSAEDLFIFKELRLLIKPFARLMDVKMDAPHHYEVWTEHEFRTQSFHPVRKRGVLFAGTSITKAHVGLYFYPLHLNPCMLNSIPMVLQQQLNGNAAFRITYLSEGLKEDISNMLQDGFDFYRAQGWIMKRTL